MIIEITRSHIKMKFGEKTVTIEGEAYLRGHGSPDFVAYSNSIDYWDPPHDNERVDDQEKSMILENLKIEMDKKKMTLEIE